MIRSKKGIFWSVYMFAILLLCLQSIRIWFFWDYLIPIHVISFIVVAIAIVVHRNYFYLGKYQLLAVVVLAIFEVYFGLGGSLNGYIAIILKIVILSSCICLRQEFKLSLYRFMLKAFGVLMIPSLICWVIYLASGFPVFGEISYNDGQYIFDNHLFFIKSKTLILEDLIFPRFSSYFLEPGHLGMITSFLIIGSNYNFKDRYVLISLVVTLFSFSLAAFVILILGYCYRMLLMDRKVPLKIISGIIVLIVLIAFFKNYNNGENPVNSLIIDRLTLEDGNLKGDNRTNDNFNYYFDTHIGDNILVGLGNFYVAGLDFEAGVAGVKVYLLTYGIIGLILAFLLYFYIFKIVPSKLGLVLFMSYILCFVQASYPLWELLLIIFICGVVNLKTIDVLILKRKNV